MSDGWEFDVSFDLDLRYTGSAESELTRVLTSRFLFVNPVLVPYSGAYMHRYTGGATSVLILATCLKALTTVQMAVLPGEDAA